jgi:hypothetical protein
MAADNRAQGYAVHVPVDITEADGGASHTAQGHCT